MHITTAGLFTWPPLSAAIATFGIDRVMFSIDYPYGSNEMEFLDSLPLAPADVEKIAHANADAVAARAIEGGTHFRSIRRWQRGPIAEGAEQPPSPSSP